MEYVLIIISIVVILRIVHHRIYKKSIIIMYWFTLNTFLSPVIYYTVLGETIYHRFNESDYDTFSIVGVVFLLSVLVLTEVFEKYSFLRKKKSIQVKIKLKGLSYTYALLVMSLCLIYFIVHRNGFPLYQILLGTYEGSLHRPDMTGDLPYYITVQCFYLAIAPLIYFFFLEYKRWGIFQKLIWICVTGFFSIVGGNKGVLVYLFVFIWLFKYNMKINWKICVMGAATMYLFKVLMGENSFNGSIISVLEAPLRRFFVTQGATLINTLALYNKGYTFKKGQITVEVYRYIYGVYGGSAPCFYLGELILKFGYLAGMFLGIMFFGIMIILGNELDRHRESFMYEKWPFYFCMYLLGNAGFTKSFFLRLTILAVSMLIINLSYEARVLHWRRNEKFN